MPKIIHVSDIHFGTSHANNILSKPGAEHLTSHLEESPTKYFCPAIAKFDPKADLIFFSGDFVTGKDKDKDYSAFETLLRDLAGRSNDYFNTAETLNFFDRVLIVPGNHDPERGSSDPLKAFKEKFNKYLTPYSKQENTHVRRFAPLYIFDSLKIVVYCLSTVELAAVKDPVIEFLLTDKALAENESLLKQLKERLYMDPAAITNKQIEQFREVNEAFIESMPNGHQEYVKIILTHHPFMPVPTPETKPFSGILNGASFIEFARGFGYQVLLHGHVHTPYYSIQEDFKNKKMIHIGTPAFGSKDVQNGLLTLDLANKNSLQATFRMYNSIRRTFEQKSGQTLNFNLLEGKPSCSIKGSGMKLLLDKDIRELITENKVVKNGDVDRIEASSYDCALGSRYKMDEIMELTPDNNIIVLKPNEKVTVCTAEEFDIPKDMVCHTSVKSFWMHTGLVAHISNVVDPGFSGKFFFPITNVSDNDIRIPADEAILTLEFFLLDQEVEVGWTERNGNKKREDF